ncbi:RCC1 domain-containing protein, partial [Chengkuizengella marina]
MKKIKLSLRIILSFIIVISLILPLQIESAEEVDSGLNLSHLDNKLSHIAGDGSHTLALKSDGTVYGIGASNWGQIDVSDWKDIIQVEASIRNTIGLKSNGTVITTGRKTYFQSWTDIVQVDIATSNIAGLKSDGTVVVNGLIDSDIDILSQIEQWLDIVQVDIRVNSIYGLKSDGTVVATGDSGQKVGSWVNIVQISSGVGLKSDGTVVTEDGLFSDDILNIIDSWTDIIQISANNHIIMGLKSNGTVVAAGEFLNGNSNDIKKFESWTNIVQISTGTDHAVGLRSDGTLVAVGESFYGQIDVDDLNNINAFHVPSLSGIESGNQIVSEGT